jgi:transcriptional regulator with PAS, ATPase and Fis domain
MTIRPNNLPQEVRDERKEAPTKAEPIDKMLESVQRLERQTIIEALKQTKRNKTKAAKILNISIPTLFKRIKQCKINLESI